MWAASWHHHTIPGAGEWASARESVECSSLWSSLPPDPALVPGGPGSPARPLLFSHGWASVGASASITTRGNLIHPEIPPKPRVELPGHSPAQSAALAPPAGNDSPIEGVASRCLATSQKPAPSFPVLWFSTHKELPGSDTEVFLLPCKLLPSWWSHSTSGFQMVTAVFVGVLSGATESGLPATASAVCLEKMSLLPYLAMPGNRFNEEGAAAKRHFCWWLSPKLK